MIFRPWTTKQFIDAGFVRARLKFHVYEKVGIPLYSSTDTISAVWLPRWAEKLHHGLRSRLSDEQLASVSATAIRSDDPDAFVEAVLAAYALGGPRAVLDLAAQDVAHEQTLPEN